MSLPVPYGSEASIGLTSQTASRYRQGSPRITPYPSPFFDVSRQYMPKSVKELFRHCSYYARTNGLVATVLHKTSTYGVTDLLIETENPGLRAAWDDLLFERLRMKSFLIESNLDRSALGNSIVSVHEPFVKMLRCPSCRRTGAVTQAVFKMRMLNFYVDSCPAHTKGCTYSGPVEAEDWMTRSLSDIRLIRWDPLNIDIVQHDVTGQCDYYLNIPQRLKTDLLMGRRDVVAQTPQAFFGALKEGKALRFRRGSFYHIKRPSLVSDDSAWGTPLVMAALQKIFMLNVHQKAQEAVLFGHILPMRVIHPVAASGQADPWNMVNLSDWREKAAAEIRQQRLDPNHIALFPLPIGYQNIGGEGKALMLSNEIRVWAELIVTELGVPPELIFCMRGDTRLQTERGMERMEDVVNRGAGGSVLTHLGPGRVTDVWRAGVKEQRTIRTRLGLELGGAVSHPVMTLQPDLSFAWTLLKDVVPGSFVCVARGGGLWSGTPPALPKHALEGREKELRTPTHMTTLFARLLGYLAAEGFIGAKSVNFTITDEDVFTDFLDCFEASFGYRPHHYVKEYKRPKKGGSKKAWGTTISRKGLCRFLNACGLSGKSREKSVPWAIMQATESQVGEFIKGYFEGDGGISFKTQGGHCAATSKSPALLRDIHLLLLRLGVVASYYRPKSAAGTHALVVRCRDNLLAFQKCAGFVSGTKRAALGRLIDMSRGQDESVPFVHDRLREFREKWSIGNNNWQWERLPFSARQDEYSIKDAASVLGCGGRQVLSHIGSGRLVASRATKRAGWRITASALADFCTSYGKGVLVSMPRLHKGATRANLAAVPLDYVGKVDQTLRARIEAIKDSNFIFDEVLTATDDGPAEMYDLTVEGVHCYLADGIVSHNSGLSFSGSNVSLRMMENDFIRNQEDNLGLVRFIIEKISAFMRWTKVDVAFKPFKMADDLQRSAFDLQLVGQKILSKKNLLEQRDHNPQQEEREVELELEKEVALQRKVAMGQAETSGQAQMVATRYQIKAQAMMAEAAQPPAAPGPEQAGQAGPVDPSQNPEQVQPPQAPGSLPQAGPMLDGPTEPVAAVGPSGIVGLESPLSTQNVEAAARTGPLGTVPDVGAAAESYAAKLRGMSDASRAAVLGQLRLQAPGLHAEVVRLLNRPEAAVPMPTQAAPRRGPGTAQI